MAGGSQTAAGLKRYDLYIGGAYTPAGTGAVFESTNPATGEPWALVADASPEDVDRAVAAAASAFADGPWRSLSPTAAAAS